MSATPAGPPLDMGELVRGFVEKLPPHLGEALRAAAVPHWFDGAVLAALLAIPAADAEDLTSQTFITALENLAKLRDPQKFTPWVFTIARNKASDYFRKKLSRPLEEFNDEIGLTVENRALTQVDHDRLQDLETLISNLNEVEQEYLRLRIVANLPFAEIASILRKPEGSVKKKYYRLLERLKAQVER